MVASEARIAANRANALKSTGPRTAGGKERSRANSYKHGMTGAGVVVGAEEAEAIRARTAGFRADYRPVTGAGRALVDRAAALSVRVERCAAQEAAAVAMRARGAEADFDEARMAEVDRLMDSLPEAPGAGVRRLSRMPEGVDRMIGAWLDLRSDLGHGEKVRWSAEHEQMAENLLGRRPDGFGTSRVRILSRAIRGDFDLLAAGEGPSQQDAQARKQWARVRMVEIVDAEVARLRDHRETLDLGAIEVDREGAAARALFDPSKEATLARRYEAAAERMMYRALREMRAVEAANPGTGAAATPAWAAPSAGRLGSFSPPAPPAPAPVARPVPAPSATPPAAPKPAPRPSADVRTPAGRGYSMVPITVGRPG